MTWALLLKVGIMILILALPIKSKKAISRPHFVINEELTRSYS
jgi:hypothetical protein